MNLSYVRQSFRILMASILMLASLTVHSVSATGQSFSEHQIKAVYIYRLANFIRWDNKTVVTPILCAIGRDSTTVTLDKLFAGSDDTDKKRLHSMNNLTEASQQCDLLYITERKLQLLQTLPQYPNLVTVSDSAETLSRGGMIELRTLGQQVKPVLSLPNLEKAYLSVSSQLLRIAILDAQQPVTVGGSNE